MNVKDIAVKTGTKLTNFAGRTGLKLKKYSPEILVVAGTASIIAGVVFSCKATIKAEEVLDKHNEELEAVKEAADTIPLEEYSENDYRKDTVVVYAHTVGRFIKLYAPGVGFTILGIGCFLSSYGILKKRNVALMAAYKTLEAAFDDYRKRVKEELGDSMDKHFMYGTEKSQEVKNNDTEEKDELYAINGKVISPYARFFDETSTEWTRSNETNRMILTARQNWANDLLNSRGHVFLNEVYDMLGMKRSKAGSVVGWVKNNPNGGDNFIDFGIFNAKCEKSRDFVNGYEYSILLDFNVDGVIWDLI